MKRVLCFFFGTDPVTTVVGYLFAIVVAMQATRTASPEANYFDYLLSIAIAILGRASADAREYKKPTPPPTPDPNQPPTESNGQENNEKR